MIVGTRDQCTCPKDTDDKNIIIRKGCPDHGQIIIWKNLLSLMKDKDIDTVTVVLNGDRNVTDANSV